MIATTTYPRGEQRGTYVTNSWLKAHLLAVLEPGITPDTLDSRVARRFIERLATSGDEATHELVLPTGSTSVVKKVTEQVITTLLNRRFLLLLPWGL
jgi:ribonucleotide reductase alpha subunit